VAQTPCPCCRSGGAQVVATRNGKTGEPLLTLSCDGCGLGRIDPLPTEEELARWYALQYRQAYKAAVQPALRHVLRAGRNALHRWQWLCQNSPVADWVQSASSRTTLDIGASSGEYVALMRSLGFNAMGVEPHQGYASYASESLGLSVRHGTLQAQLEAIDAGSLDLVTLFHVFEHLTDPVDALRRIASRLKQGGVLYIEVPNATRPCSPHYMFFRAHTLYFTGTSLRQTLHAAGFTVLGHSPDDADNLSVVATPGGATASVTFDPHGHPLVKAQQQRRWVAYLWSQLLSGRPLRKWQSRQEEKREATRYPSGRALLDALYRHLVTSS